MALLARWDARKCCHRDSLGEYDPGVARRPSELGEQRRSQSAQVGQLLLQARVAAGRSQTEAAERLGLLQPAIAKLEAGTRRLTFCGGP